MVTTFTSRELVRDELAALFVANGSWQAVYNYFPSAKVISQLSPVLIIRSRGTAQAFSNLETNPASYQILITSWVVAGSETDSSITSAIAEDELDTLDKTIRQVIRNNAGSMTTANNLRFTEGFSEVSDILLVNVPYIIESYTVIADLARGAI